MSKLHLLAPIAALLVMAVPGTRSQAQRLPDQDTHTVPCRPTITCTADLVPPGTLEIELGFITRQPGSGDFQFATPLLLKLTLARWLQLQVGTSGGVFIPTGTSQASYLDNISVGGKFHLRDQTEAGPSASLSAAIGIPTYAGQGAYTAVYNSYFILYLTKDFGWLHADMNAGVFALQLGPHPVIQGFSSLALSVSLPHAFGLMLEGYGFTDAEPVATRDAGALTAVSFSPKPWLTLDIGVDASLIQSVRRFSVFTGMTAVPARLWQRPARGQGPP